MNAPGYRSAAPPPFERVTVLGRTESAMTRATLGGGALLFVGMVGAALLGTAPEREWKAPSWAWAPWLLAFATLAALAAARISRLKPAYVIEIHDADVKLLDLRDNVLGSVRVGSLRILPGQHSYIADKSWGTVTVAALLIVAPGVHFSLHAGRSAPADEAAPPWPWPVPSVERPRHVVPGAAFEALRGRVTRG